MSQLKLAACSEKRGRTIKVGSVSVKVYPTPTGRYPAFTVVYHFAGARKRQKFASRSQAVSAAETIATRLSNGDTAVMSMSSADQASFARCQELARRTGKPIEIIMGEYLEVWQDLAGAPLKKAVSYYKDHHPADFTPLTVPDLVDRFLEEKRRRNVSKLHLDDLSVRCRRFAAAFTCPLLAVTREDFSTWLAGMKDGRTNRNLGPRSMNNYRMAVLNLVAFAKELKQAPKDWDEFESVKACKAPREKIQIWTPAEMRLLLDGAATALATGKMEYDLIPYLVLGGFAGPRQAELMRLEWRKNVKLGTNQIMLGCEITKTDKGRQAPMSPNLAKWLIPYTGCYGPICGYRSIGGALMKLARYVGLKWRHNALRHSFITYRVALTNDVSATALEAGNSVQEIHDSYLEYSITAEEAKAWFDLMPQEANQKVLALNFTGST